MLQIGLLGTIQFFYEFFLEYFLKMIKEWHRHSRLKYLVCIFFFHSIFDALKILLHSFCLIFFLSMFLYRASNRLNFHDRIKPFHHEKIYIYIFFLINHQPFFLLFFLNLLFQPYFKFIYLLHLTKGLSFFLKQELEHPFLRLLNYLIFKKLYLNNLPNIYLRFQFGISLPFQKSF